MEVKGNIGKYSKSKKIDRIIYFRKKVCRIAKTLSLEEDIFRYYYTHNYL